MGLKTAIAFWLVVVCHGAEETGKRLANHGYRRLEKTSLMECTAACRHDERCKSVNFQRRMLQCEMNDKDFQSAKEDMVASPGTIFIDQFKKVNDPCSGFPCSCNMLTCSTCTHCEVSLRNWQPFCVVDIFACLEAPSVENAVTLGGHKCHVGDARTYRCNQGYIDHGSGNITCSEDGTWSAGVCKKKLKDAICGLATNKPVKTSSGDDAFRATDGNFSSCVSMGPTSSQWLIVDLQSIHVIQNVFIINNWSGNTTVNITIHVLKDITEEDTAVNMCTKSFYPITKSVTVGLVCKAKVHGRYVRISNLDSESTFLLCEVDVCGLITHCDLSLNKSVEQGSSTGQETQYSVQPNLDIYWWSVDLGEAAYVTSLVITDRTHHHANSATQLSNFDIRVLQNSSHTLENSDTGICRHKDEAIAKRKSVELFCDHGVIGRYVTITTPVNASMTHYEVDVCGTFAETMCEVNGFIKVAGKCVKIHTKAVPNANASNHCRKEGAKLLKIENKFESEAIKKVFLSSKILARLSYFIGAQWSSVNETFLWEDGAALQYSDWHPDYPRDGKDWPCVILKRHYNMRWKDNKCAQKHSYICELRN